MRRRRAAVLFAGLALILVVSAPGAAAQADVLQIETIDDTEYPTLEVTVEVPSALEDVRLSNEAFAVRENDGGWLRPYMGSSRESRDPVAPQAVLALDVSGSMRDDFDNARAAANAFLASVPEGTEIAVVTFGDRPQTLVSFTTDLERVRERIAGIEIDGSAETALFDGMLQAASLLPGNSDATQSIVLLSDGGDTVSRNDSAVVERDLRRRDAVVWVVALETRESNREALQQLAGEDGEVFGTGDAGGLEAIYRDLASDLSRRYVLRYDSSAVGETDVTVLLDWENVNGQATLKKTIEGQARADDAAGASRVVNADPTTVTVPLLGSTGAYVSGLSAFAAGSFLFWFIVFAPRRVTGRERLQSGVALPGQPIEFSRRRLGAIAEWTTDFAERRVGKGRLGKALDRALESAGLDLRPGEIVVFAISVMVVVFAVGIIVANAVLGLLLAAVVPVATGMWLSRRRDRRQAAFSDQLTDVLQLITGSLRAGYGLLQGIDAVSRDAAEPASGEFRRIIVEHRLGRDLHEAMNNCAIRMDNDDFAWVVQAIGIHRDVGGDLARVLDNIVSTVRDRADVHREVRTLSAEGKMSAVVLIGLPFVVLGALQIMNPEYIGDFLGSPVGWALLISSGLSMLLGTFVIRRMVRIRY